MIDNPFIFKTMDVSTAHMTEEDARKLTPYSGETLPAYELGEYGWLVYVGEMKDNWEGRMSDAFMKVLEAAKELGCDYVRFDRDGQTYEELQLFDW